MPAASGTTPLMWTQPFHPPSGPGPENPAWSSFPGPTLPPIQPASPTSSPPLGFLLPSPSAQLFPGPLALRHWSCPAISMPLISVARSLSPSLSLFLAPCRCFFSWGIIPPQPLPTFLLDCLSFLSRFQLALYIYISIYHEH